MTARQLLWRDSFLVTVFAFIFVGLLYLAFYVFPFNYKFFHPFKEAFRDFDYTDLYYNKFDRTTRVDTNIVLVNIGTMGRKGIGILLDSLTRYEPAVVGVDMYFRDTEYSDADTLLRQALRKLDNVVMMYRAAEDNRRIGTHPFFGSFREGYGNIYGAQEGSAVIRYFRPFSKTDRGNEPSFTSAIAEIYDDGKFQHLLDRKRKKEVIRYLGNFDSFITIEGAGIVGSRHPGLNRIAHKIVLVGYIGDRLTDQQSLEDYHFTPLNNKLAGRSVPDMRGVVIHANILYTILNRKYIERSGPLISWGVAFLIAFCINLFMVRSFVKNHKWFHFQVKLIQLLLFVIFLLAVFWNYETMSLKFDSLPVFVIVILSVDLLYFYDPIAKLLHDKGWIENTYFAQDH